MLVVDGGGISLDRHLLEGRAGDYDILFAINITQGPTGEALANILLVLRVDVSRVTDIDGRGNPRVWQLLNTILGYTYAGKAVTSFGVVSVLVELRQLHHIEVKGEVCRLLPDLTPALD